MSLILALGSNLGDRLDNLLKAHTQLQKYFKEISASHIYESPAVDYLNQPPFLNQVVEYELPALTPKQILLTTQSIEVYLGRIKNIPKGPRTIDIDIIFVGKVKLHTEDLIIPHPSWSKRSFVLIPLLELPHGKQINQEQYDLTLLTPSLQKIE